ncbi:MAG TPA: L,D-transpeptidase family protein [Terracidiphilus sp.]|nr:L,D-transpeptidase family protein [Terracidiphilus sp.]
MFLHIFGFRWRISVTLALLPAVLFLSGCTVKTSAKASPREQQADRIIIIKSSHTMMLMSHGKVLKTYQVSLGRGGQGPKVRQGDNKTPEGEYVIDRKIEKSRFHLALHISYPNVADKERAQKAGVDPGGAIEIHGLASGLGWLGPVQHDMDWTEGCIAVSNSQIEEIWRLVPVGTPVDIKP